MLIDKQAYQRVPVSILVQAAQYGKATADKALYIVVDEVLVDFQPARLHSLRGGLVVGVAQVARHGQLAFSECGSAHGLTRRLGESPMTVLLQLAYVCHLL